MADISIYEGYFGENGLSIEADTSYTFNAQRSDIPPSSKKSPPQSYVSKVLKIVSMRSLISQLKKLVGCLCCVPLSSSSTFVRDVREQDEIIDDLDLIAAPQEPINNLYICKSEVSIKALLNLELKISAKQEELKPEIDTLCLNGRVNKEHWEKMVSNDEPLELQSVPWFDWSGIFPSLSGNNKTHIKSINLFTETLLIPSLEKARELRRAKNSLEDELQEELTKFDQGLFTSRDLLEGVKAFIKRNPGSTFTSIITGVVEKGISGFRKTPESLLEQFKQGYEIDPQSTQIQLTLPLDFKDDQVSCKIASTKKFTLFKEGSPNIKQNVKEVYLIGIPRGEIEPKWFKYISNMD